MTICPTCAGLPIPAHPAGWLAWHHDNLCALRAVEDSTAAADHDRVNHWGKYTRPATSAELTLLAALGYPITAGLLTTVNPVTASVVRRSWPALTTTT